MEDLAVLSGREIKSAAAKDRERREYSSAEGQYESVLTVKFGKQAFWKLEKEDAYWSGIMEKEEQ